jgi:tetratricopeptide (TPR) repeat protein/transglutaminase-like putative cysteine protease
VRKPDGTVVVTPSYNIQDMPGEVSRLAPVYSDLREKHITVKALGVGDTLEYRVRTTVTRPQVPGQFWFSYAFARNVVSRDEELEVSVPRGIALKISTPEVQPRIKDEGRRRIYTWKTANLDSTSGEKKPKAHKGAWPSVQVSTFRTWEEVGHWYGELQKPEVAVTPLIRAKATELTAGLTSNEEKIRALYAFVSTKIHYVGLSFGIGRYRPHPAEEVLGNEYGDCKDKHTLLAALIKAAGYDAWPALVNSAGMVDPDVPSPGQFDHVITVVQLKNELLWLDATSGVAPFGMLFGTLRDQTALVIPEGRPSKLMCTPAQPPFPSFSMVTVIAKLAGDGTLTARFERTDRSDFEMYLRAAFRSLPQTRWQDLVQQISYSSSFSGVVTNVDASSPDDASSPFRFSYDYTRKEYGDWADRQIILPLPPLGLPPISADADRPTEPIELGPLTEVFYRSTLELPPEYDLVVPKPIDLKREYAEYHATYSLKDHVLVGERRLTVTRSEVALSELDAYRVFEKAISDDHGTWLKLENGTGGAAETAAGNPEAKSWFDKAMVAVQQHDVAGAEDNLLRVLKIDPAYPRAHAGLGVVYFEKGQPERGLAEARKEAELHPKDTWALRALARTLVWLDRENEAIDAWTRLLKVDPRDRDAAADLGELLVKAKRYTEALQVIEPAAKLSQDSASLQVALGLAYLSTKQPDKALVVLKRAVELDASAEMLNHAAYRMADENVLLDQAEAWAQTAVAKIEAESATMSLSALTVDDLDRMNKIAEYWDTLGWVYFRTGELEKAEKYLRAAWALSQRATVGVHLGRLCEHEHKRDLAAHLYELALAAEGHGSAPDAAERYRRLTGKTLGASATTGARYGRGSVVPLSAGEELLGARAFRLPRITTESAAADFFVLLTPGSKTADVKLISGSAALRDAAKLVAALPFVAEFPDDRPVKLIRRATISCGETGCELVLLTPGMVHSLY